MDHEHEEVEQIPWAMLAEQLDGGRRRSLGAIGLAVIAALVAGLVAVNVLRRPTGTTVELAPGSVDVAAAGANVTLDDADADPPTVSGDVASLSDESVPAPPSPPALYSEADLMAGLPGGDERLAAARAEWFVADYFTVLGPDDPVVGLPDWLPLPEAGDGGYAWVEWVRASSVTAVAAGRHEVTVLFRSLRRSDDGALVRTPVRAVVVDVVLDVDGSIGIAGLPQPVGLPAATGAPPQIALSEPPDDVAAAAIALVGEIGADPRIEGATEAEDGWLVIVSVVDNTNVRWPLRIDVPAARSGPES